MSVISPRVYDCFLIINSCKWNDEVSSICGLRLLMCSCDHSNVSYHGPSAPSQDPPLALFSTVAPRLICVAPRQHI